jgi:hypothetical protein
MVVAPFRQWRITATTSEQQNRPAKPGGFFVSLKSIAACTPESKSVRNVAGW